MAKNLKLKAARAALDMTQADLGGMSDESEGIF